MIEQLTPLILTFNEKENIRRTLDSLMWAREITVLDSFSTDDTVDICKSYPPVKLIQRAFDTHTRQWNFGLDQIQTRWVLSLDADYALAPALRTEIAGLSPSDQTSGYSARFLFRVFGRPLRASLYPPRVVLFRKDRARYIEQGHTQWLDVTGQVVPLKNVIVHDDRKPLSRWLQSQDRYMKIEARHLLERQKEGGRRKTERLNLQDRLRLRIFFAPPVMFLYLLFGRGLILDGWPGWYYVLQRTIAEMLLSLRLLTEREGLEEEKGEGRS